MWTQLYNHRNATFFGFKTSHILIVVVLVVIFFWYKVINGVKSIGSGIVNTFFGESEVEKKRKEADLKDSEKKVAEKQVSYGIPTSEDKRKADLIHKALNGYINNFENLKPVFASISGKYEMNRIYSAYGIRTIDKLFSKDLDGDLNTHLTDVIGSYYLNLKHFVTKDGLKYSINDKLKWLD